MLESGETSEQEALGDDNCGHYSVYSREDIGELKEELAERMRMWGISEEDENAAPTDLSAVRADYPELNEKLLLIEEKLNAEGHADTFQIIDSVSQEERIIGFDRWVTWFAEHDADHMFGHVMELAEAQRQLQKCIDDPACVKST